MSLITGGLWRSALWLNISLKSLKLLEITDCRQLINQVVASFGYRKARLYLSKFFEPKLRSPQKIQTRVVQAVYLFWHIFGHIVHISYLRHLSEQDHTSSPHLILDWAAVGKLWLHLKQIVLPLTCWASICILALNYYPEVNFSVCRRVLSLRSSKQQIFYPSLDRAAKSYPPDHDSLKRDHPACPVYRFDSKGVFILQCIREQQYDTSLRLWIHLAEGEGPDKGLGVREARQQIGAR